MSDDQSEILDVEINNILHRMNLDRSDIAELPDGATIAVNVTTHRQAADLIKRLAKRPKPVSSYGGYPDAKAASGLGSKEQPFTIQPVELLEANETEITRLLLNMMDLATTKDLYAALAQRVLKDAGYAIVHRSSLKREARSYEN